MGKKQLFRDKQGKFIPPTTKGKIYLVCTDSLEYMGETTIQNFRSHSKNWGGTYIFKQS